MYEYLDRKPEAGDIVECQTEKINSFSKNKLYICKKLEDTMLFTELDDKGSATNGLHPKHFKVVKTKSGSEAKVDDTCIWVEGSKIGQVFKATNAPKNGFIPYGEVSNANQKFVKVLHLSNNKPKAYYKRSGLPWTIEELKQIPNWCDRGWKKYTTLKFVYAYEEQYFIWSIQRPELEPQNYNTVAFEDEFPAIKAQPITIPIGSHWQEMYTSTSKGPIVEIVKLGIETVHFENLGTDQRRSKKLSDFLNRFVPIDKPDSVSYEVDSRFELPKSYADIQPTKATHQINDGLGAPSEPTPTIIKEPTMNFQQLIKSIFQEEIQTDYDKKPDYLVVIYNNEGTEIAQATADSIATVEAKIQSTPKLWGCKAVCYKIDTEVQTQVPVTSTKIKKSK